MCICLYTGLCTFKGEESSYIATAALQFLSGSLILIFWTCFYKWNKLFVTGSAKPDKIVHFSTSILLYLYNLHTQINANKVSASYSWSYSPTKVAVTERSDLYSKHKLQVPTKSDATYKWSNAQTWNLYHYVCHELRNGLLGKLFLLLVFTTTNKIEIHEETLTVNNHFDIAWINSHNLQFLGCTAIE